MGAVCSCFGVSASNDHGNSTDTTCFCFDCCLQKIKNKYASIRGGRGPAVPSNNNSAPTRDSVVLELNTSSTVVVTNRGNPRYSRVPQEATSQDRGGSGHSRVEHEHQQHGDADVQVSRKPSTEEEEEEEAKLTDAILNGKALKEGGSEGSAEYFSSEMDYVHGPLVLDLEDEDCCPTCLEGYTLENPKIVAKCSHHYHLGCIYEWKERSESCPVCGKLMTFDEML